MIVHDCEQGTPDWFAARLGIPTASEFSTVMAKGRAKGTPSATRRTYMLKLAGERMSGQPMEAYTNGHMDRGKEQEAEARNLYAFTTDADPELVGFITNDDKTAGGSPDALIGENGLLEIKSALPHILLDKIDKDTFPAEHVAQCQGNLWISEREWIDIAVYWPGLPMFIKRATRDEAYIAELSKAVDQFNEELTALVEKLSIYGEAA